MTLICDSCGAAEYNLNNEGKTCGRKLDHGTSTERHCTGMIISIRDIKPTPVDALNHGAATALVDRLWKRKGKASGVSPQRLASSLTTGTRATKSCGA
jgi:hypothetical protein